MGNTSSVPRYVPPPAQSPEYSAINEGPPPPGGPDDGLITTIALGTLAFFVSIYFLPPAPALLVTAVVVLASRFPPPAAPGGGGGGWVPFFFTAFPQTPPPVVIVQQQAPYRPQPQDGFGFGNRQMGVASEEDNEEVGRRSFNSSSTAHSRSRAFESQPQMGFGSNNEPVGRGSWPSASSSSSGSSLPPPFVARSVPSNHQWGSRGDAWNSGPPRVQDEEDSEPVGRGSSQSSSFNNWGRNSRDEVKGASRHQFGLSKVDEEDDYEEVGHH